MPRVFRRSVVRALLVVAVAVAVVVGGYGFSLTSDAGRLPWQAEPTRIPIVPFADIPGFSVPTPTPDPVGQPSATPAADVGLGAVSAATA